MDSALRWTGKILFWGGVLAAAAVGGAIGARRFAIPTERSAPAPAANSRDVSLLREVVRRANSRVDDLEAEKARLEERIARLGQDAQLQKEDVARAESRARAAEREALSLRDILVEEELRYRAILEGLKRWDVIPGTGEREPAVEPVPEALLEGVFEEDIAGLNPPELLGEEPRVDPSEPGSPIPPQELEEEEGIELTEAEARQALDEILASTSSEEKYRFEKISGVTGGTLQAVVLVELGERNRPRRRFVAERAKVWIEAASGELVIEMEEGRIEETRLQIPFFDGRYKLIVGRADSSGWSEATRALAGVL